ncbi:MAG TPA: hypothetical protein VJV05_15145, partial [Pyrinomonadaceae bacterium]|nr:hypothetical protein [Pyrinomonadaceae bacterium]
MKYLLPFLILIVVVAVPAFAQKRDYMTEPEIELIRNNQDIDKRIDVLTKMIDRRFTALGVEVGGWKQSEKDNEKWGDIRSGTKTELLYDIKQLLQKAVDDVDDVALHNDNTLAQNKVGGELFPKGVRSLAAAANRYLEPLKATLTKTTDERDKGLILSSIESCEAI